MEIGPDDWPGVNPSIDYFSHGARDWGIPKARNPRSERNPKADTRHSNSLIKDPRAPASTNPQNATTANRNLSSSRRSSRRRKSELNLRWNGRFQTVLLRSDGELSWNCSIAAFGIRISVFFRISAFGFRISSTHPAQLQNRGDDLQIEPGTLNCPIPYHFSGSSKLRVK
jgi:hypothetical protein